MSFDPRSWSRLQAILDRALDLDAEGRRALLDEECADDAGLRTEAERLLRAADRAGGFLEEPLERYLPPKEDAPAGGGAPERAGPFRIEKLLGQGGMGEVYLAERDDGQFRQRVALKLIRTGHGPASEEISRRFLLERQILARLEHPNIARLVDGGLTADGRPYFAMEYVEGRPISGYADGERLDLRRRVELFLTVCDAVRHAHGNLIVHRDLKPSNILVADEGTVKLLDFGIAKLLAADGSDADATATSVAMTPEYAAPEQVRGDPVTTATDVHGLGLVLYELLCGARPFHRPNATPLATARLVLESDPRMPSRVVAGLSGGTPAQRAEDGNLDAVSRDRRGSPDRLRRALAGDLDAIAMRALRKEPLERYPSVDALRDDLENWLDGRPVAARRGTNAYRARKFARRHRAALAAAALVLVSILGGFGIAVWQAFEARRSEAKADAVTTFLVEEMIGTAAPEVARGREITVREVLDAAAARTATTLADQPEVAAVVRSALGRTYAGLGALDDAVEQLEAAVELLTAERGEHDPETLRVRAALAGVLVERGDYDRAEALLNETLRAQESRGGPRDLDVLTTRGLQADLEQRRGNFLAAERAMREVLAELESHHPGAWRERLLVLSRLVRALEQQRKNGESEAVCLATLALQREHLGADHPDTVRTLALLGQIQRRLERQGEAEETLTEARALAERVLGAEHPDTLRLFSLLGAAQWYQGKHERALETFATAEERAAHDLGPDHPAALVLKMNRAVSLRILGRLDEAEPLFLDLIERTRRTLGESHPTTIKAVKYLGTLYWHAGRMEEAERRYREVIDVGNRLADDPDADATALNDFAWFLLTCDLDHLRDPQAALKPAERAVELTGGRQAEFLDTLAAVHHRLGDLERAIELQWQVMRLPDAVYRIGMERAMVGYLEERGDPSETERFLRENLDRRRETRSSDDPLIALSLKLLGRHYLDHGSPELAEREFREAIEQLRRRLPEDDRRVGHARGELGLALVAAGRFEEAERLVLQAYETVEADAASDTPDRRDAVERVVRVYEAWDRVAAAAAWRAKLP